MTNVLIPAFNEQEGIHRPIRSILSTGLTPLVIANGCEDETANIARCLGAEVIELEAPGKMPALQTAFLHLGERAISEPLLILDADSWPVFPRNWVATMSAAVTPSNAADKRPRIAVGQRVYRKGVGPVSNGIRTGLQYVRQARALLTGEEGSWPGGNMALRVHDADQLSALLEIPHLWPGEDHAMKDTILSLGGVGVMCLSPFAAEFADSRFHRGFFTQLKDKRSIRTQMSMKAYEERGAPGSVPYQKLPAYRANAAQGNTLT